MEKEIKSVKKKVVPSFIVGEEDRKKREMLTKWTSISVRTKTRDLLYSFGFKGEHTDDLLMKVCMYYKHSIEQDECSR